MSEHFATRAAGGWATAEPRRRQMPIWSVLAVILLVGAIAGAGIFVVNRQASESAEAEVALARIESLLRQLVDQERAIVTESERPVDAEIARLDGFVADFVSLSVGQSGPRLLSAWTTYRTSLVELVTLRKNRDTGPAQAWDAGTVRPDGERFQTAVENALIDYRARTIDFRRYATAGTVLAIGAAAIATCALFLAIERQRNETTRALAAQELRYRALAQNTKDLVTVVDRDGTILYQSPSMQSVLGRAPASVIGTSARALLHPDDHGAIDKAIQQTVRRGGEPSRAELRLSAADGSYRTVESLAVNLLNDPAIGGVVITSRDVTERMMLAEKLEHLAFHDALTGLPNRALFMSHLTKALARSARSAAPVSVLFLDLDGFKLINDTLGHDAGDTVLSTVAGRLLHAVRPGDTVARLGGDEFTIVLEEATSDAAIIVAGRIAERLSIPVKVDGHTVQINTSVGIAVARSPVDQPEDLLRQADAAMYQAKQAGKGRYALHGQSLLAGAGMTGENV